MVMGKRRSGLGVDCRVWGQMGERWTWLVGDRVAG